MDGHLAALAGLQVADLLEAGQLAAGVHRAGQQVRRGDAAALAGIVHVEYGVDGIDPVLHHDRGIVVQHHDHLVAGGVGGLGHLQDHLLLRGVQLQRGALAVHAGVGDLRVGEHHHGVVLGGGLQAL